MAKRTKLARIGLVGAVALLSSVAMASAETMKVIFVAAPPPSLSFLRIFEEYVVPTVDERLAAGGDFKIDWTRAFGGSLAGFNDTFEAVENGIAQMALTINSFEQSNLPLENLTFKVPFGSDDPALINSIHRDLHKRFPAMDEAWTSRNQVYLGGAAADTYHLVTTFPVTKIEDLEGKRIGASGSASSWMRAAGAVPVTSSMGDSFTNIKNGLYDGYPMSTNLAFIYKAFQAANYITETNFGATIGISISFNKQAWDKMPPYAQEILREEITIALDKYSAASLATAKKFKGMMSEKGVKFTEFPQEERRRWALEMPNIPQEWAESVEKQGIPASEILEAYLDALRDAGVKLARDWDKE